MALVEAQMFVESKDPLQKFNLEAPISSSKMENENYMVQYPLGSILGAHPCWPMPLVLEG